MWIVARDQQDQLINPAGFTISRPHAWSYDVSALPEGRFRSPRVRDQRRTGDDRLLLWLLRSNVGGRRQRAARRKSLLENRSDAPIPSVVIAASCFTEQLSLPVRTSLALSSRW